MNAIVRREVELLHKGYKDNPKLMLQTNIQENEKIQGYRGRELLELLQNAVDELEGAKDKIVKIELNEKTLCVSNNGRVFSEDGVISLMYSNLSPKYKKNQYIGNKGTGFRSILNWAESVSVFSGELSIEFSPKYAEEELQELLKNENVAEYEKTQPELKMATLVAPKIIENISNHTFDTTIRIELIDSDEIRKNVRQQLSQLDAKFLLFLENLEHLIIIDSGNKTEYIKQPPSSMDKNTVVSIKKITNDKIETKDDWCLSYDNGKIENQSYRVTVAYKLDMSVKPDNLYSFFKTDVSFPIPALVHGTFDLTEDRNHLIKNKVNELVLTKIVFLLVDVAKDIAKGEVSYLPLQLLTVSGNFPTELSWCDFDFSSLYRKTIEESKVFPTVNSEYISFVDNLKFYSHDLAEYLCGEQFKDLLIFTKNIKIKKFITQTALQRKQDLKYGYADLVSKIDNILPELSIKERAACCAAFLAEYEDKITSKFPSFILDVAGNKVDNLHTVFLQPEKGADFSEPPSFANIRYLNLELRRALEDVLDSKTGRALSAKLDKLNVREYNLTTIIQSVVSKLRNKENKGSKKTRSKCVSTVKWFWRNRKIVSELNLKNVGIPLVARDGIMRNAEKLYWGIEYGNRITENLFTGRSDLFVSSPTIYDIDADDLEEFTLFFSALGVAKYPRLLFKEKIKVSPGYVSLLKEKLTYPITVHDRSYFTERDIRNDNANFDSIINATVIENFEYILEKASTKAIILWLKADANAFALVSAERESGKSCAYLNKVQWQYYRTIPANKVWCYMRYEFFNQKWIDVSGERYAPADCILFNKVADKLLPHIIAPNLDDFIENINKKSTETSEIKDLLSKLGVADEFSKLSVPQFYNILLTLPTVDTSGELSRSLYMSIIMAQGFGNKSGYESNASFKEYMERGSVFCKDSKGFISVKEAYYLREKTVSREVLHKFNIVDIPNRQSKQTIEAFLGVKPFPLKGKMEGVPVYHELDNDFAQDFKNYIVYALCYRIKSTEVKEISKFKSLKVRLCNRITANYDGNSVDLNPYDYIKGLNNEICLRVPPNIKEIGQLKTDIDFCAVIAEIVTSTIDIQETNLFSRLRELYNYDEVNRRKVLLQEFGGFDILSEARGIFNFTQSHKEQFLYACEQIGGINKRIVVEPLIDKINFDDFNNIDNSDIIIEILSQLDIDVDEFNEKSEFTIDLIPFYKNALNYLTEQNKSLYKNSLFESLLDKSVKIQECFLKKYYSYGQFDFKVMNSVNFKADMVFYAQWKILNKKPEYNADDEYRKNRVLFKNGKDTIIIEDLLKNTSNDSLLYFDNFDVLDSRYDIYKEAFQKEIATEEALKSSQKTFTASLRNVDIIAPLFGVGEQRKKSPHGNRSTGMGKQRANEDWGLYAERSVYYKLAELYGEKSVMWVSENARKDNVNPDGEAGHGYDMKYINENSDTIFVEVKSAKSHDLSFIITESELRFAEKHAKNHEIILVTDIENEPIPYRLPNMFSYTVGESRSKNSRFAITLNGSYTVQCELGALDKSPSPQTDMKKT